MINGNILEENLKKEALDYGIYYFVHQNVYDTEAADVIKQYVLAVFDECPDKLEAIQENFKKRLNLKEEK